MKTAITLEQFIEATQETLFMMSVSLVIGSLIGIPLGILLVLSRPGGMLYNRMLYTILNPIINVFRSMPFIILLVAIIPFTRLIVGTSIGTMAAVVPLTIFIAPMIARLIETAILEVNLGIIEAAHAMGATPLQLIRYFLLPEAMGSIILSLTTATIALLGATAMAGTVGGGGIGDLAIVYGYQRFDNVAMLITVVMLIVIVQIVQSLGNFLAKKIRRE